MIFNNKIPPNILSLCFKHNDLKKQISVQHHSIESSIKYYIDIEGS